MEELVSIIMPAHNAEAYIAQAIESVLAQTWKCWELIIVDDASSDHSYEIAEAYAQKYTQIRVLKNKENQGTAGTRKKGIRQARGSWIAFGGCRKVYGRFCVYRFLLHGREGKSSRRAVICPRTGRI